MSVDMASPLPEDGIRRVSISPTDTEPEPDDMEPCADPLPMEIDERPGVLGSYEVRFPAETPVTPPAIGLSHAQWCDKVMNESLPGDGFGRGCFDTLPRFVVGDPSARFETHTPLTYETNGETGQPLWKEIFGHILKECAYLTAFHTVYVMVDTRNLKAHETSQEGLPHWPAAVAWWHSRVQLVGPHQERTELLYFPATEETGLHRVHPTWAGTFVLAALVAVFPGINFILLDSDCLPITLFEAADLWKEGFLARFPLGSGKGLPQQHPLHRRRDYVNRPDVVYTQHRVNADRQGQGVLLVTEPHSELNAGLVVVFSSAHPSIFNWSEWTRRCRRLPDTEYDSLLSSASEKVVQEFLKLLTSFLHRTLSSTDLIPQEKQQWIQSGLALSPLVGTCTQYSVDFCLAWALIGEWTSRILFPVPKGPWPRHGHAGALLRRYQARSPLIYYVIGNTHYQAVLLAEESVMNRGRRGENRLWKRVTPTVTEFAWLPPNIAESFCKNALYRDAVRTYCAFDTPHLGLDTKNFVADVFVENILYLGDTRSADDLSVFTKMAPERLCLGCGLRVDEPFAPISTGERKKLFYAAQKLLTFVLHEVSAQTLSEEETALQIALRPLITNKDGHFVAAVISMYQSLLEGKTDCPISGVFGAGKTLSAAAMIAGLLVMDPSLTIMIVTKENVAAHAFVKHFLRLGLPESINCLVGRLVGYVEMKKGPANQTALDIPPAFRNDVLRSKRVLVGCGGGFHQECQQPYSPVASWMEDADVALNDEGQQYGNLDEASAIARVPRKCLVIWCGDHKQTPGGLRKTDEAKAFRRKLLRRPIALRGDTEHFQPNMLGKVVLRYLDGMDEPLINRVQVTLRATMGGRSVASAEDIVTLQLLCQEVGCPYHEELRSTACSVALVVLWMGLHQEKFPLLATTLQAAAGVSGPQKWALILPSSARVSLVTYTAVIAVRYPELDNVQNDLICFGNYLLGEQATSGGFLPLFGDAPSAYMHAATDIGSAVDWLQSQVDLSSDENGCLAVLHNRNKMVATFGNSEWVTQSDGAVQSKSVTSCAGMTAHFVLLAQTKVGFLSGGRSRHMKELSEKEVLAQLEEAYARATVALTRAQKLCIIMGPLDMRGLPGAATVIGCLKYGAGVCGVHVSNQAAEVFLKDGSLNDGPDDEAFLQSLRRSLKTARGAYPPVALAEIYQEFKSPLTMIRRLHLMVVDLGRSRSVSPQVYQDFMNCRVSLDPAGSLNTLPVPISGKDCPFQTRYVFAYGMDNSDRPSYLLWPIRGGNGQFLLVDPWSGNYFDLEAAKFVKPIGIERFFDAFSLEKKRPLKVDAASALNIPVNEVSDLLVVSQDRAKRFELTPVWAPAEPPTKRAKTAEVRLSSASNVPMPPTNDDNEKGSSDEEDSDSSGSNSDVSSQDDSSDVSDLEKFDEAYTDFGALTKGVDPRTLERDGSANPNEEVPGIDLPGGMKALHSLANVPKSWPLARLTIPLSAASKHLERLLEGCCNMKSMCETPTQTCNCTMSGSLQRTWW